MNCAQHAKDVLEKAGNPLHGTIPERVGADRVIFPEREMGLRVSHAFSVQNVIDFLDVAPRIRDLEGAAAPVIRGPDVPAARARRPSGGSRGAVEICPIGQGVLPCGGLAARAARAYRRLTRHQSDQQGRRCPVARYSASTNPMRDRCARASLVAVRTRRWWSWPSTSSGLWETAPWWTWSRATEPIPAGRRPRACCGLALQRRSPRVPPRACSVSRAPTVRRRPRRGRRARTTFANPRRPYDPAAPARCHG